MPCVRLPNVACRMSLEGEKHPARAAVRRECRKSRKIGLTAGLVLPKLDNSI